MRTYGIDPDRLPREGPLSFESFLTMLGTKDRASADKHLLTCAAQPDARHAILWQRLVCRLMILSGHSAKLNRTPVTAQFYAADGKYRRQVFAIEDRLCGHLSVYCGDVLDPALAGGDVRLVQAGEGATSRYSLSRASEPIDIQRLDSSTPDAAAYFKDMVGWNRKSLRIDLPISATSPQIAAVEALCAQSVGRTRNDA